MLPTEDQHIYSVSEFNRETRLLLEQHFGFIWLEGEISNLSRPASGHWYLTLKDSQSQIRCAMFRGRNRTLRFKPQNGDQVLVRGAPGLYEARGDFQLILDRMEPVGEGLLQRQFEQIKSRLQSEGLFDDAHKKPLPSYPQTIGVITSATGAAIRDVLHVLERRYPAASVIVYPAAVQGEQSVSQLIQALNTAVRRKECDVLLLVRGGGSLEDLWSFNEEALARAIFASPIPIVSGVGHETDFTIADLVADVRAPTPSAAAEMATPDIREETQYLESLLVSLSSTFSSRLNAHQKDLQNQQQRLLAQHPQKQLQQKSQRIDDLEQRLNNAISVKLQRKRAGLGLINQRLNAVSPSHTIPMLRDRTENALRQLCWLQQKNITENRNRLTLTLRALNNVSPLATLERGYAVLRTNELKTVDSISGVESGDRLVAIVRDGEISCRVEGTAAPSLTEKQ